MCGVDLEALDSITLTVLNLGRACFPNIRRCIILVGRPQMCGVHLEALGTLTVKLLHFSKI